jgi:hypothetical protein
MQPAGYNLACEVLCSQGELGGILIAAASPRMCAGVALFTPLLRRGNAIDCRDWRRRFQTITQHPPSEPARYTKPLRGWKSGPVLSERRYEVRLSRLPALSIIITSLAAGRRVRRISVGGLP